MKDKKKLAIMKDMVLLLQMNPGALYPASTIYTLFSTRYNGDTPKNTNSALLTLLYQAGLIQRVYVAGASGRSKYHYYM